MLTPAAAATLLVVNPAHPLSLKMRAAASTIASTVAFDRACVGFLRITDFDFLMRVDNGGSPGKNLSKLLAFWCNAKETPLMSDMLSTLCRYQAWANGAFFEKLELVDPVQHQAEFRQAMRLMNHAYVVAEIFAAHLAGNTHAYTSDNTEEIPPLADLRAAVAASDRRYLDYVRSVTSAQLSESIAFSFTDGDKGYMSREEMITHVALHGGYHRGEVGRILTRLSVETPWDTFAVFLHRDQPARRQRHNGIGVGPAAALRG